MKKNSITEEKIDLLKKYFGWDDDLIAELTPRDLQSAYKIMEIENEAYHNPECRGDNHNNNGWNPSNLTARI